MDHKEDQRTDLLRSDKKHEGSRTKSGVNWVETIHSVAGSVRTFT